MGYKDFGTLDGANGEAPINSITLNGNADSLDLPDASFVKDSHIGRDGMDLVLHGPKGEVVVEDYFAQAQSPTLVAPDGSTLTPNLVNSFVTSNPIYADAGSMNDESPVGAVQEMSGDATVTRVDGSTETLQLGAPIYQGDIIETGDSGAVNIVFIDETSFAVSEDARLAIDEYVFDPSSSEGLTNFSVLKGKFVFTSGMIGREDPDDVQIDTPVGSIGIRGTIIAGDVDSGEITVVEGAIVLKDNFGNEITLANQFETAQFDNMNRIIHSRGVKSAGDVADGYKSISNVSPNLFSSIDDAAQEGTNDSPNETLQQMEEPTNDETLDANQDGAVDGTVDQNNDGAADGTVDDAPVLQDGGTEERGSLEPESENTTIVKTRTEDGVLTTDEVQITEAKQVLTSDPLVKNVLSTDGQLSTGTKTLSSTSTTTSTKTATTLSGESTLLSKTSGTISTTSTTSTKTGTTTTTDGVKLSTDLGTIGSIKGIAITELTFDTFFSTTTIAENVSSSMVGSITAVNGSFNGAPTLLGDAATYLQLFTTADPNTYDIYLRSGESFDFERMSRLDLRFSSTSLDGGTVVRAFSPSVDNVAEAPIYHDQSADSLFKAASNIVWQYDFRQEFFDQDAGDNLTYSYIIKDAAGTPIFSTADGNSFTGDAYTTSIEASSFSFNSTTGVMQINFDPATIDQNFRIEVIATDSTSLTASTGDIDFYTFANNASYSSSISGSNLVISRLSQTFSTNITGNDNKLFLGNNDDIGVQIDGDLNYVNTGGGDDQITISVSADNSTVASGYGNDTILIRNADSLVYGGEGNDTFTFDLTSTDMMMTYLMGNVTGVEFDGGTDSRVALDKFFINFTATAQNSVSGRHFNGKGDMVSFSNDGGNGEGDTIDFSAIHNSNFKNIEILNFDNADANDIYLNYQDIFDMTDQKKTIVIRGDTNDTLTLNAQGEAWSSGGTITDETTGDVYDTYFIGDVTVLVDTQVAEAVV